MNVEDTSIWPCSAHVTKYLVQVTETTEHLNARGGVGKGEDRLGKGEDRLGKWEDEAGKGEDGHFDVAVGQGDNGQRPWGKGF